MRNGDKYIGAFKLGQRSGEGSLILKDGSRFDGTFEDDNPIEGQLLK